MDPFSPTCIGLGVVCATTMVLRGVKRKSLSNSGAIAAWMVGFLIVSCGLRGFVLVAFYLVGTKATKYHKLEKQKIDASALEGSIRDAHQVLASSILAVACSLLHAWLCGEEKPIDFDKHPVASSLSCAVLSHHATCLADTLASEMGILSKQQPVLVTKPWKHVPPGTNGGVTVSGTLWSAFGGALMAICTIFLDFISGLHPLQPTPVILFGTLCGLLGSLLDSVIGATLQASYYDPDTKLAYQAEDINHKLPLSAKHISGVNVLTNAQVNLVSVGLTIVLSGWVLGPFLFSFF